MTRTILICALAVACLTTPATAQIPDLERSTAEISEAAIDAVVTVSPDGSWTRFDAAFTEGGALVDATITLTLRTSDDMPIPAFPPDDIWLETSESGLVSCTYGSSPDQETDLDGQTFWREPLAGGGCTEGEFVVVYVLGSPLIDSDLPLTFRSFDTSGDLMVNLTDIVIFSQALGAYNDCSDYNNDGVINLTDIVRLTNVVGTGCS